MRGLASVFRGLGVVGGAGFISALALGVFGVFFVSLTDFGSLDGEGFLLHSGFGVSGGRGRSDEAGAVEILLV